MLASRPAPSTDRAHGQAAARPGATSVRGLRRIARSYGLSLLAAALGLPVLAAGLITTNNCALRGGDCTGRLMYAVIGAVVLAGIVQFVLLLHSRLGWLCWAGAGVVTATAVLHPGQPLLMLATAAAAPGIGAWVSEPARPDRWRPVHRLLRMLAVVVVLAASALWGIADGR